MDRHKAETNDHPNDPHPGPSPSRGQRQCLRFVTVARNPTVQVFFYVFSYVCSVRTGFLVFYFSFYPFISLYFISLLSLLIFLYFIISYLFIFSSHLLPLNFFLFSFIFFLALCSVFSSHFFLSCYPPRFFSSLLSSSCSLLLLSFSLFSFSISLTSFLHPITLLLLIIFIIFITPLLSTLT